MPDTLDRLGNFLTANDVPSRAVRSAKKEKEDTDEMGSLLYFLETVEQRAGITPAEASLFTSVAPAGFTANVFTPADSAPGGVAGLLLADEPTFMARRAHCEPARQSWRVWDDTAGSRVWVGVWNNSPPKPAELLRQDPLDGIAVTLEDGNQWTVPLVRYSTGDFAGLSALPQAVTMGSDGKLSASPLKRYRALESAGMEAWELVTDPTKADAQRVVQLAIEALAVNYRVTAAEVGLLELLTIDKAWAVVAAMVQVDLLRAIRDAQKKKPTEETPG